MTHLEEYPLGWYVFAIILKVLTISYSKGYYILGCLKNAKSLKSKAPQGFSGCLDIENDERKKKIECIPWGELNAPKFIVLPYEATDYEKNVLA